MYKRELKCKLDSLSIPTSMFCDNFHCNCENHSADLESYSLDIVESIEEVGKKVLPRRFIQ